MRNDAIIGIVGSGIMGTGIAQIAAAAGQRVQLFDARPESAEKAAVSIGDVYRKLAAKGKMTESAAIEAQSRIHVATALEDMKAADLVVEAVVEDLEVKRDLFAHLEAIVPDGCILASNTSSISITLLAAKLRRPERVAGMHFFNPVPLMELVEVVKGLATSDAVAAEVFAAASRWGKTPVYARSTPGFIVNRVARPFYAEALRLLNEQAASPASIDAILRDAGGFRMGPFELMDLIGHDTNFAVTKSIFNAYFGDQRFTPSLIQQELVEGGRLGRKTGRGFFDYSEGARPPVAEYEPWRPAPVHPTIHGEDAFTAALVSRLHLFAQVSDTAHVIAGDATILLSDGATAADCAIRESLVNVVLVDHARDFATAKTLAVARAAGCSDAAFHSAVGLLQSAGYKVIRLRDLPGLAVLRTMSMLANEAADTVNQGVCTAEAVDAAMRKGVNYPTGPLEWAKVVGPGQVREALRCLADYYGEDRYRMSPLLREM